MAIVVVVTMFGLGVMTELLRHPLPTGAPGPADMEARSGDPRDDIVCEAPPREGQPREEVPVEALIRVSSSQLYDCPQTFDGTTVRYRGEVVGAVLRRGDEAWVQLNDDVYGDARGPLPTHRDYRGGNAGVGVRIPGALADQIVLVGGPKHTGDVLEVTAVFHRVDATSGELAVLRALQGEVVTRGRAYDNPLLRDRLIVAAVLAPLALGLVVWQRLRHNG